MQKIDFWTKGPTGEPVLKGRNLDMLSVESRPGIHGDTLSDWVRQYHQGVLAIDEGVGRLLKTLEETGQRDNTLIVFTSDQGFGWGQHGFRHKLAPYDSTIRSPLIVSMPGTLPENAVCPNPVSGVDLVPTFFSFAGIDVPWKMHGHDLTPLLKRPASSWPHPVLTTLLGRTYGSDTATIPAPMDQMIDGIPWWISLRQGRYKYIRTLIEGEIEELYDLQRDPEELTNLALQPQSSSTLRQFRQALIAELKRTDAALVDHLPAIGTPER
jgi:arylsulfatase A-like enzyme